MNRALGMKLYRAGYDYVLSTPRNAVQIRPWEYWLPPNLDSLFGACSDYIGVLEHKTPDGYEWRITPSNGNRQYIRAGTVLDETLALFWMGLHDIGEV